MYSGDPVAGTGWTENSVNNLPGDRNGVGSHGPFTFAPGDMKVFDVAYPWAQGTSNLNSVTALKQAADNVQAFYNNVISASPADVADMPQLQLYPNPASEAAGIVLPGNRAGKASIILRDVTGREVMRQTARFNAGQRQQINISGLSNGMYLVQVQLANYLYSIKLLKQ
ncbi:MAG: T9SS type A sorting domain-containing protein [Sphingobacteriales bacterium]|nr:MAG: T9SS type A sorting domain-containing protein [Sphingobacteriales bacterium]